jgi:hypothetical protein
VENVGMPDGRYRDLLSPRPASIPIRGGQTRLHLGQNQVVVLHFHPDLIQSSAAAGHSPSAVPHRGSRL